MARKAIFGGTFDPIHNGHINIAYEALEKLGLQEIIFMPSGNPPHKSGKNITDSLLRYEMTSMAVRGEEKFSVSDYEVNKESKSYTYETVSVFNRRYPEDEWYFIAGLDSLMYIDSWAKPEVIFHNCKMIILMRSGYKNEEVLEQKKMVEEKYNTEILFLEIPRMDISSTNIRERLAEGKAVKHLMPADVAYFCEAIGFYKNL